MSEDTREIQNGGSLFDDAELLEAVQNVFGADALKLLQEDEAVEGEEFGQAPTSVAAALEDAWAADAERSRSWSGTCAERQVVVSVGPYQIGIPLWHVMEVHPVPHVTPLPGVAGWIRGVWNRRGEVTALCDLRQLFGVGGTAPGRQQRVITIRDSAARRITSLMVDAVIGLRPVGERRSGDAEAESTAAMRPFVGAPVEAGDTVVWPLKVDAVFAEPTLAGSKAAADSRDGRDGHEER